MRDPVAGALPASMPVQSARRSLVARATVVLAALLAAIVALALELTALEGAILATGAASLGVLAARTAALRARGIRTPALSPVLALPSGMVIAPHGGRELVKRVVDVAVAVLALVLLAPILLLIIIAVAISDGGPVFYAQWRVGRGGETFRMLKFRSMRVDAEREWIERPGIKYRDDDRVTAVGRLLRRTSLDELPQLLHVLSGRMSIVGPRPLPIYEAPTVPDSAACRWTVRPGLTCSWQVSGRSDVGWAERMGMDRRYAEAWSLSGDLALMARTVGAVLTGRGAY